MKENTIKEYQYSEALSEEGVNEWEQIISLQTWDIADRHQSVDHLCESCDYCPSHLIDLSCVTSFYISWVEGRLILEFKTKRFYDGMRNFYCTIIVMPNVFFLLLKFALVSRMHKTSCCTFVLVFEATRIPFPWSNGSVEFFLASSLSCYKNSKKFSSGLCYFAAFIQVPKQQ